LPRLLHLAAVRPPEPRHCATAAAGTQGWRASHSRCQATCSSRPPVRARTWPPLTASAQTAPHHLRGHRGGALRGGISIVEASS